MPRSHLCPVPVPPHLPGRPAALSLPWLPTGSRRWAGWPPRSHVHQAGPWWPSGHPQAAGWQRSSVRSYGIPFQALQPAPREPLPHSQAYSAGEYMAKLKGHHFPPQILGLDIASPEWEHVFWRGPTSGWATAFARRNQERSLSLFMRARAIQVTKMLMQRRFLFAGLNCARSLFFFVWKWAASLHYH